MIAVTSDYVVAFRVDRETWDTLELRNLTGCRRVGERVFATLPAAKVLGEKLGTVVPDPEPQLAGDLYTRGRFPSELRPYQKAAVRFAVARKWSLIQLPARTGKTPVALGVAAAIGAQRLLILCPANTRLEWASQVSEWLDRDSLVLDGRKGAEAFRFRERKQTQGKTGRIVRRWIRGAELLEALQSDPVIVSPYDILVGQTVIDWAGAVHHRPDLVGWANTLSAQKFDLAVLDECHLLRNRLEKRERAGQSRRSRTSQVVSSIPRRIGLTATPMFSGSPGDLWGQLDTLSDGTAPNLWDAKNSEPRRTPFAWEARYCDARKTMIDVPKSGQLEVWQKDGTSNEEELKVFLGACCFKRTRAEVLPDLPKRTRTVVRIEGDLRDEHGRKTSNEAILGRDDSKLSRMQQLRLAALDAKIPTLVDAVLGELAAGEKVIVGTYHREAALRVSQAINKAMGSNTWKPAVKHARDWLVSDGLSGDARFEMARRFREYVGPAVIVSTIDAMQVGIRLDPASSVHLVEWHWSPSAIEQFSSRPYLPGVTRGLSVIHYTLTGSVDDASERVLIPKLEAMAKIMDDADASDLLAATTPEKQSIGEIWKLITAGMPDLGDDDDVWED